MRNCVKKFLRTFFDSHFLRFSESNVWVRLHALLLQPEIRSRRRIWILIRKKIEWGEMSELSSQSIFCLLPILCWQHKTENLSSDQTEVATVWVRSCLILCFARLRHRHASSSKTWYRTLRLSFVGCNLIFSCSSLLLLLASFSCWNLYVRTGGRVFEPRHVSGGRCEGEHKA